MHQYIRNLFFRGYTWIRNILSPSSHKYVVETFINPNEDNILEDPQDEETTILLSPKLSLKIPEPKYYMFLDTETTGIPEQKSFNKYYEPHYINFYDMSRMIELGYLITDDVGNKIKEKSFIIKPEGFVIKNSNIHGITMEKALAEGIHIREALEIFYEDLQTVDKIIAHNMNFDKHILLSECYREYRADVPLTRKIKKIAKQCTMIMGQQKLNTDRGPKLVALHKAIFNKEQTQEHRALSDVYLCYECYFNMNKL